MRSWADGERGAEQARKRGGAKQLRCFEASQAAEMSRDSEAHCAVRHKRARACSIARTTASVSACGLVEAWRLGPAAPAEGGPEGRRGSRRLWRNPTRTCGLKGVGLGSQSDPREG